MPRHAQRTLRLALLLIALLATAACASASSPTSGRHRDHRRGRLERRRRGGLDANPTRAHDRRDPRPLPEAPGGACAPADRVGPDPVGPERKEQMVAYVRRHYGSFMKPTWRLRTPKVIVIHYTETPTFQATYNTFAPDTPDPELHELPNTCAHFVIDRAGGIHQLVPLDIMCRHTVGLNWTAIGIEHVGYGDWEVLDDKRQFSGQPAAGPLAALPLTTSRSAT